MQFLESCVERLQKGFPRALLLPFYAKPVILLTVPPPGIVLRMSLPNAKTLPLILIVLFTAWLLLAVNRNNPVVTPVVAAKVIPSPAPPVTSRVNVKIRYYTSTKNVDLPMPNEPLTLKTAEGTFEAKTNKRGIARFSAMACGKEVTLKFTGTPRGTFTRQLACGKNASWEYHFDSFAGLEGSIKQMR
jgi:hypothetical protein